jgi:hypothetical protein
MALFLGGILLSSPVTTTGCGGGKCGYSIKVMLSANISNAK